MCSPKFFHLPTLHRVVILFAASGLGFGHTTMSLAGSSSQRPLFGRFAEGSGGEGTGSGVLRRIMPGDGSDGALRHGGDLGGGAEPGAWDAESDTPLGSRGTLGDGPALALRPGFQLVVEGDRYEATFNAVDARQANLETIIGWMAKASTGDAESQFLLAEEYRTGAMNGKKPEEAVKWYRRSAEKGWPEAEARLGVMHLEGDGVPKDEAAALKLLLHAAGRGSVTAQEQLVECYTRGIGVTVNLEEAAKWQSALSVVPTSRPKPQQSASTGQKTHVQRAPVTPPITATPGPGILQPPPPPPPPLLTRETAPLPPIPQTATPPVQTYMVTGVKVGDPLMVRSGPGMAYDSVGKLSSGMSPVFITDQAIVNVNVNWVPISFPGGTGWVRRDFLQPSALAPASSAPPNARSQAAVWAVIDVTPGDPLTVRKGPGASYTAVAVLPNGRAPIYKMAEPLKNGKDDWVPVYFPGGNGWVRPKFLGLR